ncbi:phage capsid protein [Bradyrhizobium sp. SZCCHNRI2049]|uniref:phage capsid protein n=1 Tax=Bradyrhizobium sp. SZCCHNRI2049 TaxID=3057287 RepID=UPI00291637D5|nr:phage capsid protein [Bradyrhizobium sp. SZCCHNRI2049]
MANANPSRVGQQLGAGDTRALFLKVFSGEVLTTFNTKTLMKEKTRVRNISSGKSAQFPAIGRTKASYHTPGTEIVGDIIQQDEKVITIDDLLIADTFIARIDEAMSQFEVRSEYSRQMGDALAQTYDRNLLSLAVKAARDGVASTPTGLGIGAVGQKNANSVKLGSVTPAVQTIIDAAFAAATGFDLANIPEENRLLLVDPATYYALVTSDKLLNLFYNPGNNGSYSDGTVKTVAGFQIVKTNNLRLDHTLAANTSVYPDYNGKYGVNASDTVGLFYHPQALGTVKLLDLSSEMEYDIRRQGTLMVSKMAVGHGVLRPECIWEIRAAT